MRRRLVPRILVGLDEVTARAALAIKAPPQPKVEGPDSQGSPLTSPRCRVSQTRSAPPANPSASGRTTGMRPDDGDAAALERSRSDLTADSLGNGAVRQSADEQLVVAEPVLDALAADPDRPSENELAIV